MNSSCKFGALLIFSASVLLACDSEKIAVSRANSFETYIEQTSQKMCAKMHKCYAKLFRTLPSAKRKAIGEEQCRQTVLRDKEYKIKQHTPEMRKLARACYNETLQAPCRIVAQVAFFNPACLRLNLLSEQVYINDSAPPIRMPWE